MEIDNVIVQFRSDGIGPSPAEYARLLAEIAERRGAGVGDYSRGGIVAELEYSLTALLGAKTAAFPAAGMLADHLAVRLPTLERGRRALQRRKAVRAPAPFFEG